MAKRLLQPGDCMTKLDLKDAYSIIQFLFTTNTGDTSGSFIKIAPRTLAKILKPVATLLRSLGNWVVGSLRFDDAPVYDAAGND